MRRLALLLCGLVFLSFGAQAQVQPSGQFTPGHTARILNPQGTAIGDAGGAAGSSTKGSGYLSELGVTNQGTPVCINSDLIRENAGYYQLCFGANANGKGVISYNAYGGAALQQLSCIINGTEYNCVNTGSGNIVGPGSSVIGDCVVYNSINGQLVADAGTKCLATAATNAELKALTGAGAIIQRVYRAGFYAAGDGGRAFYNWSSSACPIGGGDNGYQVAPNAGTGCWIADFSGITPDVRVWGAKPDDTTDVGPFMQAAYNAKVGCITIPANVGAFLISSGVTFSSHVPCFRGEGWREYNQNAACPTGAADGSWLHVKSASFTPFTFLDGGFTGGSRAAGQGGFFGMAFCQDHPPPTPGWAPTAYPPLFDMHATINSAQVNFETLFFYGIYAGINNDNFGRFSIKNIRGQVFSYWLQADNEHDRSVMDDVWIWPFWSNDVNVMTWQQMHGVALRLLYVDGLHVGSFGAFGYNACIQLENGASTFSAFNNSFGSVLCDQTAFGVLNHSTNATVHFGSLVIEAATNYWTTPPDTECIKSTVGGATITADHFRCLGSWYGAIDMSGGGSLFIGNGDIDNTDLILDPNVPMIKVGGGLVSVAANMNLYCPGSCSKAGGAVFQPITNWDRGVSHYDPGIFFYPEGYEINESVSTGGTTFMQNFAPISRANIHGTGTLATYNLILPVITEEAIFHSDVAITSLAIGNPPMASWPIQGCPSTLAAGGTIRFRWHLPFPGASTAVWECY